ncbi:MAG TPA: hypothetical protein VGM84_01355 [Steroidobacteraceae bacterium]|jgi:hypothetical protein
MSRKFLTLALATSLSLVAMAANSQARAAEQSAANQLTDDGVIHGQYLKLADDGVIHGQYLKLNDDGVIHGQYLKLNDDGVIHGQY